MKTMEVLSSPPLDYVLGKGLFRVHLIFPGEHIERKGAEGIQFLDSVLDIRLIENGKTKRQIVDDQLPLVWAKDFLDLSEYDCWTPCNYLPHMLDNCCVQRIKAWIRKNI